MVSDTLAQHGPGLRPLRRDAIDFWRGLLFCTIFINHMPGNVFETLTPKNYGFSDSAEAFVFISGLSLALAYGVRFSAGEGRGPTLSLLRRSARLYGVHIVLSLAGLAVFGAGAILGHGANLLDQHGRALLIDDPVHGLLGLASLGHQLGYFNILPVYVLILAMAPALMWIGARNPWWMVIVSGLVYVGTRLEGWTLPTWPVPGTWFFDPFAWQFMLAIGIAAGLKPIRVPAWRRDLVFGLAVAVLGLSAFSVTNGLSFCPGLQDWTRTWADLDKTMLGLGRLIHFLSIVYVLHSLAVADRLRGFAFFQPLCTIGRSGIAMFCLLSLLAAVGQVAMAGLGHHAVLDGLLVGGGLALLYRVARLRDPARRVDEAIGFGFGAAALYPAARPAAREAA